MMQQADTVTCIVRVIYMQQVTSMMPLMSNSITMQVTNGSHYSSHASLYSAHTSYCIIESDG